MLENPRISTVKLKKYIKTEVSYLPSHFGVYLKKELTFSKKNFSFIDLGLHFYLYENKSCSTFVANAGFFYWIYLINRNFLQVENT